MQRKHRAKVRPPEPHAAKAGALIRPLLTWFKTNARDLPWRGTSDPYAIWISEIMLQQTQVKTVVPYWQRWMRELPTVRSLARARPEKILKLWEGLGYYTRARNLQKAAQMIAERHAGHFPEEFDDVLALPGVGRYTAGAICSIAFNQPTPVLDGNVIRVLTRVFGIAKRPREQKTNARLWALSATLVREAATPSSAHEPSGVRLRRAPTSNHWRSGLDGVSPRRSCSQCARDLLGLEDSREPTCSHLNQALMELGALICSPRQPQCLLCPLRSHCVAFRENRTSELPNLEPRLASTSRRFVAFVVERKGRFLVRQRPAGVINARLWEFPNAEADERHSNVRRIAENLFGSCPSFVRPLHQVRHTITRYRITLDVFRAEVGDRKLGAIQNGRWYGRARLRKLAFPSAHRKIVRLLQARSTRPSA